MLFLRHSFWTQLILSIAFMLLWGLISELVVEFSFLYKIWWGLAFLILSVVSFFIAAESGRRAPVPALFFALVAGIGLATHNPMIFICGAGILGCFFRAFSVHTSTSGEVRYLTALLVSFPIALPFLLLEPPLYGLLVVHGFSGLAAYSGFLSLLPSILILCTQALVFRRLRIQAPA